MYRIDDVRAVSRERIADLAQQLLGPPNPTVSSCRDVAKGFRHTSVELDAIAPDALRGLLRAYIEIHLPAHQLQMLQAAEQMDQTIAAFATDAEWNRTSLQEREARLRATAAVIGGSEH